MFVFIFFIIKKLYVYIYIYSDFVCECVYTAENFLYLGLGMELDF